MKLLKFFALLFSVSLALSFDLRGLPSDNLQQQLSNAGLYTRITNGHTAASKDFLYQVGLQLKVAHEQYRTCGGSIINEKWALTAAHCMENVSIIFVYINQKELDHSNFRIDRPGPNVIEHHGYNRTTLLHDIALFRIFPRMVAGVIRPTNLPPPPPRSYFQVNGTLAGWGVTSKSGTYPASLQYAIFTVISNSDCSKVYGRNVMSVGKLCATAPRPTSGCLGDSGGALVVEHDTFLIGIFSFAHAGGYEFGYPLTFTRVDHYLDWIREKTKSTNPHFRMP